jgi:hypothetical protein
VHLGRHSSSLAQPANPFLPFPSTAPAQLLSFPSREPNSMRPWVRPTPGPQWSAPCFAPAPRCHRLVDPTSLVFFSIETNTEANGSETVTSVGGWEPPILMLPLAPRAYKPTVPHWPSRTKAVQGERDPSCRHFRGESEERERERASMPLTPPSLCAGFTGVLDLGGVIAFVHKTRAC